jgi:hypothetical protein
MEAYPFAEDISLILSNYWKTPEDKRAELPGIEIIERIRGLVEAAFNANPEHAGFLKDFIAKQGDKGMISEFGDRLKHLMYRDETLVKNLDALAQEYKNKVNISVSGNVTVEWGDSVISGSTAQVKQDRNIQIDTIDPSKFVDK